MPKSKKKNYAQSKKPLSAAETEAKNKKRRKKGCLSFVIMGAILLVIALIIAAISNGF